ncbi:ATP-grasp domain-containing protein [Longispora sp. NPDC051575]|uniref:ATP-grasp domain-containing protein n=1 Tax=Longispora sp. NPDC051575 TaxID=3154943 RepID=UPI00344A7B94
MRTLVVLGGADGAITTLRTARRLDVRTVCVDVRSDAPAVAWADEFCNVSTRDVDRLVGVLAGRPDLAGVLSPASDVNLPTQLALAERLGLPCGLSAEAVRASVDKGFFRAVADGLGQPGPRYVQGSPAEVRAALPGLRLPVILKPTDSSGGRGISLCSTAGQFEGALDGAAAYSMSDTLIAEEYLPGRHLTAEAVVADGRVALLGLSDRRLTALPHFVTVEHTMPERGHGLAGRVRAMLDDVCAALAYRWGSLNVDVLVTDDGDVVLIEVGARLGGNGVAELLGLAQGVDVTELYIRMALGEAVDLTPGAARHAGFRVLRAEREGKLTSIAGLDVARALPDVVDIVVAVTEGEHVEPYTRAGAKLGYVLAASSDRDQLMGTLDAAERLLRFDIRDAA